MGREKLFLNPGQQLKRGTYFATLKEKDGENDKASFLARDGVFRLNIGVTKECYLSLFATLAQRPAKGCCIDGGYDFQKINTILPHPVYGWIGWVCVLNPTPQMFKKCIPLLDNAYEKAMQLTMKKIKKLRE